MGAPRSQWTEIINLLFIKGKLPLISSSLHNPEYKIMEK